MKRPRRPANELRIAVECLPIDTKRAMLDGLETNPIIVGAYTDRDGGVCPMLAAHRSGGRTNFRSFARAWDRYTRAGNGPRRASERELSTLRSMLETSLAEDERTSAEFEAVIAQHKAARERFEADERPVDGTTLPGATSARDTRDRSRLAELSSRPGWSWLRLFRRYDEYAAALRDLDEARAEGERPEREHDLVR